MNVFTNFSIEEFSSITMPNSSQNSGFCAVNPKVFDLNEGQFFVYMRLLKYRNREGYAFLRGKSVSMTERNIQRILKELEEKGLIKKANTHHFFIHIVADNGKLFKKFTRWFINSLTRQNYIEFRTALFLGQYGSKTENIKAVEIRNSLKCRSNTASEIAKMIKNNLRKISTVKESIRFIYNPYGISKKNDSNILTKSIESEIINNNTHMVNGSEMWDRNEHDFHSHTSHITNLKNKEELTNKTESLIESNFKILGMPEQNITCKEIMPESISFDNFKEVIKPEEIKLLKIVFSIISKQKSFSIYSQITLIEHSINLIISLKTRKHKTKISKSSFEYFCGALLCSLNNGQELFEIKRILSRNKETKEKEMTKEFQQIERTKQEQIESEFENNVNQFCRLKFENWINKSDREIDFELKKMCLYDSKKYEEIIKEMGIFSKC